MINQPKYEYVFVPCRCVYDVVEHRRVLHIKEIKYGCFLCHGSGLIKMAIKKIENTAILINTAA